MGDRAGSAARWMLSDIWYVTPRVDWTRWAYCRKFSFFKLQTDIRVKVGTKHTKEGFVFF